MKLWGGIKWKYCVKLVLFCLSCRYVTQYVFSFYNFLWKASMISEMTVNLWPWPDPIAGQTTKPHWHIIWKLNKPFFSEAGASLRRSGISPALCSSLLTEASRGERARLDVFRVELVFIKVSWLQNEVLNSVSFVLGYIKSTFRKICSGVISVEYFLNRWVTKLVMWSVNVIVCVGAYMINSV